MESVSYQGVEVDRCAKCAGLWFDMLEAEDLKKLVDPSR
jgi:Zn-finger nucleic acid-binding protein